MKFDVTTAPPPDSDIKRTQQAVKRRGNILRGTAFIGFAVYLGCAIAYLEHVPGTGWSAVVGMIMCVTAACMLFMGVGDSSELEPVPANKCAELLALLESTPESQRYRDAVLAEGRQFVQAELSHLQWWAKTAAADAACKQLYRIPLTT